MLTEDQIERLVESKMNSLDRLLIANKLTQSEYDHEVMIIDKWASQQYKELTPC